MLIQQFAGAAFALLIAGAFGSGAAKARTIGLGLFRRSIPFRALPELFQIDGFPHDHFHHPNGWYRVALPTPREFSRMVPVNSVFFQKIPRRLNKFQESHFALRKRHIFVL
jgi:hypothetical protein